MLHYLRLGLRITILQSHTHTMQQTCTHKAVTQGVEAKKLLSHRRQSDYSKSLVLARGNSRHLVLRFEVDFYAVRRLVITKLSVWTTDDSRTVAMPSLFHACAQTANASNSSSVGPPNSTTCKRTWQPLWWGHNILSFTVAETTHRATRKLPIFK